ncbi:MAG: twin-arginine translocase TatA/TatE family subunit [bacterium]|nr:twin-arginine translocase TatA/TatE family subunit [bacterium]
MTPIIHNAGIAGLGPWEVVIILVIVLIVFGAGKLPSIGSSIGEALKNFKKSVKMDDKETDSKDDKKNS